MALDSRGGVLALAAAIALGCAPPSAPEAPPPNVLLISIDTLRADRLGCYGYQRRPTSPAIDAFAADAVRFERARSPSPWTTPAHMSLMTSLYPSGHGVNRSFEQMKAGDYRGLPEKATTLAEALAEQGYRTLALTGGGTVRGELGFDRGFEQYLDRNPRLTDETWSTLTGLLHDAAAEPFFLFFHTFEVHTPYTHTRFVDDVLSEEQAREIDEGLRSNPDKHPTTRSLKRLLRAGEVFNAEVTGALYDGDIRHTDDFLARLFDLLRDSGLYERTIVVITSDHGEEFGDRDPNRFYNAHGRTLHREVVEIPLLVRVPGRFHSGGVVRQQVDLTDVAPTILDLLALQAPTSMRGRSLVPLMEGGVPPAPAELVGEATSRGPEWKSLRTEELTYVAAFHEPTERTGLPDGRMWEKLFLSVEDPEEQEDLSEQRPEELRRMRERLREKLSGLASIDLGSAAAGAVSEESLEELRSLGYLQ